MMNWKSLLLCRPLGITLFFSFLLHAITPCKSLQWLALTRAAALATEVQMKSVTDCESLHWSLVKQEMKFCRNHPAFMQAVRDGAKWAIDECQFQFKTRRWNCSTLNENLLRAQRRQQQIQIATMPSEMMQRTQSSPPVNATTNASAVALTSVTLKKGTHTPLNGQEFQSENDVSRVLKSKNKPRKSYKKSGRYRRGTREAAFVHAISSAGVAHAITRRCSSGFIEDCGCDRSVRGTTKNGFQWEGCSDNIAYGISLSKRFVDAKDMHLIKRRKRIKKNRRQRMRVARSLMNLHNNEAGRKLIENNMRVQCKCHGVSGSCEMKTCWRAMPTFREIGELLKEKFDGATEVKSEIVGGRAELQPNQQFFKRPTETDLVYLTKSPEYCERDVKHGSLGTSGRRCNKGSHSLDGCDLLCCGRGYKSQWEKVKERCHCKFHWCCYVKCSVCTRNEEVHTCN